MVNYGLKDRVALITGANNPPGIGATTALAFAREGAKVVFSGGSLYKTIGGENRYYKMVNYILSRFPEAIFWYAGTGDASQINILKEKYPDRLYHTAERSDLFQVLQNSFLYLSTYPLCGGGNCRSRKSGYPAVYRRL